MLSISVQDQVPGYCDPATIQLVGPGDISVIPVQHFFQSNRLALPWC